jgi:hypothetical protein
MATLKSNGAGAKGRVGRARRKARESVFPSVRETRAGLRLSSGLSKREHVALEVMKIMLVQGEALNERSRLDMMLTTTMEVTDAFLAAVSEDGG